MFLTVSNFVFHELVSCLWRKRIRYGFKLKSLEIYLWSLYVILLVVVRGRGHNNRPLKFTNFFRKSISQCYVV